MAMSIEEQEAQAALRRAFQSYMNGETPPQAEMEQAPLLENWRVLIVQVKRDMEEFMLPVLAGSVTGHPQVGDSLTIRTSQLVWLDRDRRWARTWNRIYRLGERARDDVGSGSDGVGA
jgi:hypothetical protein